MKNTSPPVVLVNLTDVNRVFSDIAARLVPGKAAVGCSSELTSGGCCYPPRTPKVSWRTEYTESRDCGKATVPADGAP